MKEEWQEEYRKEKKLYDAIFLLIDKLLEKGMAINTYWGRDEKGDEVNNPYNKNIKFHSLHGAATIASIAIVRKFYGSPVPGIPGCKPHRATIMAERFYKESR